MRATVQHVAGMRAVRRILSIDVVSAMRVVLSCEKYCECEQEEPSGRKGQVIKPLSFRQCNKATKEEDQSFTVYTMFLVRSQKAWNA